METHRRKGQLPGNDATHSLGHPLRKGGRKIEDINAEEDEAKSRTADSSSSRTVETLRRKGPLPGNGTIHSLDLSTPRKEGKEGEEKGIEAEEYGGKIHCLNSAHVD